MNTINRVGDVYETRGDNSCDDEVTQMQHAAQTAALADKNDAPRSLFPVIGAAVLLSLVFWCLVGWSLL